MILIFLESIISKKLRLLRIFNLAELCGWIYRKNAVLMQNKGILSEFVSKPCSNIMADPLYVEEALNNYIANAIRPLQFNRNRKAPSNGSFSI